ncbi:MAG: thioredoxin family protein [Bradymonadaceae bacterium]
MVLLHSQTVELGTPASDFELPATNGESYGLGSFADADVLVVMFICNHCPYVKAIVDRLVELGKTWDQDEVAFVTISSNDAENYPADGFEKMRELAENKDFPFPYLYDESQEVARAYGAVCTPDFFVYDDQRRLAYRGRLDDSWKDAAAVTRQDLRDAIEALLEGKPPAKEQVPSMGCSIKWKS